MHRRSLGSSATATVGSPAWSFDIFSFWATIQKAILGHAFSSSWSRPDASNTIPRSESKSAPSSAHAIVPCPTGPQLRYRLQQGQKSTSSSQVSHTLRQYWYSIRQCTRVNNPSFWCPRRLFELFFFLSELAMQNDRKLRVFDPIIERLRRGCFARNVRSIYFSHFQI
jgi:hypothetical protein